MFSRPTGDFTSEFYPVSLNTPPMLDQNDMEDGGEFYLSNEPTDTFAELTQGLSLPSIADLLRKMEAMESDVQSLKINFNKEMKKTHRRQRKLERQNIDIISLLRRLTQSNNTQPYNSEFSLAIPERPTHEPINNSVGHTQLPRVSSLPSESSLTTEKENVYRTTTTNELTSTGQVWHLNDEVDKIRLEKNRGKIPISQWCYEINVGTTDDAPCSTEPRNVPPKPNKETSMDYELSRQVKTVIYENPSSTCEYRSTQVCLLHPVKEIVSAKNERDTIIKDCLGNNLVLLLYGTTLPIDACVEMATVFTTLGIPYISIHQFLSGKGGYEHFHSRSIQISGNSPQRMELGEVRLHRGRNNDMKKATINGDTFTLVEYPSETKKSTEITSAKELNKEYNYTKIQIAIRFRQKNIILFEKTIFYTNSLYEKPHLPANVYALDISDKHRHEETIVFDERNQYQMKYLAKIPEPFHCTLLSSSKWLEISIVTNGNINPVYTIDTGNDKPKNPNYICIKKSSFNLSFKIVKQRLSELLSNEPMRKISGKTPAGSSITYDLNCFHVQIQLIHSEGFPSDYPKIYYKDCKPWRSEEFIENNSNHQFQDIVDMVDAGPCNPINILTEQETGSSTVQKRPIEFTCDYNIGLPCCKEAKMTPPVSNN